MHTEFDDAAAIEGASTSFGLDVGESIFFARVMASTRMI